jgi:hypothetical protein
MNMNMSPKYIIAFVIAVVSMFGWNAFLVTRDNKMFDAYYTKKAQVCQEMKSFHPDCHVE